MRRSRTGLWVNTAAALLVTGGLVYVAANGAGPLPALGPTFNPGTGVWTVAKDSLLPTNQSLQIPGLNKPVQVRFDSNGTAFIDAQTDHDLFLTMGYLHAKFRLFQMDLERRQGEGLLSAVVGKKALPSDEFEDTLGLSRTAQAEWQQMSPGDPARQALTAYAAGVNAVIAQDEKTGQLPYMFKLLGYQPAPWKPTDSLVIQGIMTQTLDFTTEPLDYALLVNSLGYQKTMQWFPVLPPDTQHPYDPGPYHKDALTAIAPSPSGTVSAAEMQAALSVENKLRQLPATAIHHSSNSNNWAVDGTKTKSGKALMAGDPHLDQTLPSIWYQVSADSPDYHFQGVSIPGVPIILIGHNQNMSWSLTNVQNQATLYYKEQTDAAHPNQYFWNGSWHTMQQFHYTIPVKGGASVPFTVKSTVHGPIMTDKGQTLSVDWMGAIPTPDLDVLMKITQASNFSQFRSALSEWHAPSQNFVYADDKGNIGMISAGYYPIIKQGDPWLPLPGTGQSDVIGTIPYQDVPQVYNPPTHIVFSANQREVGNNYPYYIGTTMDFFDNGYRADEIQKVLSQGTKLTPKDMAALQNNTQDYLASLIVPKLLGSLQGTSLTPQEQQVVGLLKHWNDDMNVNSSAASVWWEFWTNYLQATFQPWWDKYQVPVHQDKSLQVGPSLTALDEDLETWTLHDPNNAAFSLPNGTKRTSQQVMQQAFHQTVQQLSSKYGSNPNQWQWGKMHFREFNSLTQIPSLSYGPKPSGGDKWTVDAADGGAVSTAGPSWRFIMDWSTKQAQGVYPGGQSENPLSPWYENQVSSWWNGQYYPLLSNSDVKQQGSPLWSLQP